MKRTPGGMSPAGGQPDTRTTRVAGQARRTIRHSCSPSITPGSLAFGGAAGQQVQVLVFQELGHDLALHGIVFDEQRESLVEGSELSHRAILSFAPASKLGVVADVTQVTDKDEMMRW
jgi:hypothetical protein